MPPQAHAQMIVHALAGTVTAADTKGGSLTVQAADGTNHQFHVSDPTDASALKSDLRSDTISPVGFSKIGDQVIVFYAGFDSDAKAIALRDLGAGPFVKAVGTVVHYDKHTRTLTIKPATGPVQEFQLDDKAAAETSLGAVEGSHFDPHKGTQVGVTAATDNGKETALFLREV
ncbi:MAG TPA: hypothetical protein VGN16_12540 [Acidobacteriaceae bacterium]